MHVVFEVKTDRFTGTAPRAGVNDLIGGDELANYLSAALREGGFGAVDPWPEDHGWDFSLRHNDNVYLIVCSCDFDDYTTPSSDYIVQVSLERTLMDRLLGRRKSNADSDPVLAGVRAIIAREPDMQIVEAHEGRDADGV